MGYLPMSGNEHVHRGYSLRPHKSKSLINHGIISYEPSRLEASRLNPHAARRLIQTPLPRRKAPDDASCDNTPGLTCAPPSCVPPARWFGPAYVGNSAVLSG